MSLVEKKGWGNNGSRKGFKSFKVYGRARSTEDDYI